jgi:hypothetical protein
VYREVELDSIFDQGFCPLTHHFSAPGGNGTFVNGKTLIWNHEVLIDAQNLPKSLTGLTRPKRIIETEKINRGLRKSDSIQFKAIGEISLFVFSIDDAISMTLEKCGLY